MGLLRKKRRSTLTSISQPELSHSLSLPDLTTPLIDEKSWQEIPAFAQVYPSLPNGAAGRGKRDSRSSPVGNHARPTCSQLSTRLGDHAVGSEFGSLQQPPASLAATYTSLTRDKASPNTRHRSPSLIASKANPGSPVAFHRPFRGDNINVHVFSPPATAPPVPTFPKGADFRVSTAGWNLYGEEGRGRGVDYGRVGDADPSLGSARPNSVGPGRRRRGKGRVQVEKLNIIVAGGRGAGKTSFIRHFISKTQRRSPNKAGEVRKDNFCSISVPGSAIETPSSPTSPGPPVRSLTSPLALEKIASTSVIMSILSEPAPTARLSSQTITINQSHLSRQMELRLIDTPGLDMETDDGPAIPATARERGVSAMLSLVEGQYERVLREESRVVRQGAAGADELVHLCVYLIDARRVLHPIRKIVDPDWGICGLLVEDRDPYPQSRPHSPVKPSINTDVKAEDDVLLRPALPEADLQIRELRKRMTVLPILSHADTLSLAELSAVKSAILRDMAQTFPEDEASGFGVFGGIGDEGDEASVDSRPATPVSDHNQTGRQVQFGTPASTDSSSDSHNGAPSRTLPVVLVPASQMPYTVFCPSNGSRTFQWGEANVWDAEHSDLAKLQEAVFEVHTKALKTHARQVLYERYRTERLMARQRKGVSEESDFA